MKYPDLKPVFEAFARGENITSTLRASLDLKENTAEIIEIAYDLQAGSYIDLVTKDEAAWRTRMVEMAEILAPFTSSARSTLEVGTGEMTTLAGVAPRAFPETADTYACDISWSRLKAGERFSRQRMTPRQADNLVPFVADLFNLPFENGAIDIVWTCHALEPNGGREREAVRELMRVAATCVVLFEPSFENNTPEGQARMRRLGYVRHLPEAIAAEGGTIHSRHLLRHVTNPLNPTEAIVITPPGKSRPSHPWRCPSSGLPMQRLTDCFWSDQSMLAYPIVGGIPILRTEAAILATGMKRF